MTDSEGPAPRLTAFRSDGLVLPVRDAGPLDGPVVLALHGFPQTGACWSAVVPHLVAAGYRVLAPDQRGYAPGASPRDVRAYGMAALAGDVLALADAAGAPRFHLVGHDWGAAVGWALAAARPDRVATLSAVSVPHPLALRRALAGPQLARSWYIALFQPPVLPERLLRVRRGALARRLLRATGCATRPPRCGCCATRGPRPAP